MKSLSVYKDYAQAYSASVYHSKYRNPVLLQNLHLSIECYMKQIIVNDVPLSRVEKYFTAPNGQINHNAKLILKNGDVPSHRLPLLGRIIAKETGYSFPNPYNPQNAKNRIVILLGEFEKLYHEEYRYPTSVTRNGLTVSDKQYDSFLEKFRVLESSLLAIIAQQEAAKSLAMEELRQEREEFDELTGFSEEADEMLEL